MFPKCFDADRFVATAVTVASAAAAAAVGGVERASFFLAFLSILRLGKGLTSERSTTDARDVDESSTGASRSRTSSEFLFANFIAPVVLPVQLVLVCF